MSWKSPPGLGSYMVVRSRETHPVAHGKRSVPLLRAILIERNKYAPGWAMRGIPIAKRVRGQA